MNISARHLRPHTGFAAVSLFFLLTLPLLLLFAPPDGIERSPLLQFAGRFHPLSVHFPIAVLLLVPLVEILGRKRNNPALLITANFLLGIATCSAILAATLGWCLARGGGYSGQLVQQHMWGGVLVAIVAWVCWLQRLRSDSAVPSGRYSTMLAVLVLVVSFTGYRGGQLTHGANHLTVFMPEPLRKLTGVSELANSAAGAAAETSATLYGARIQPLFDGHCITCHGAAKHKANLRLDSYTAVMHGSKNGAVIKAGDPKGSELFHRITLPPTDDDFMPAENKRPLSSSDVKLIEAWISSGASRTLSVDAARDVPAVSAASAEADFPEIDPVAVLRDRETLAPALSRVQSRLPNVVSYQSRNSANLVVNASWLGSKFNDDDLAALTPLIARIVYADLSGTAISDRSASVIGSMKQLLQLRLAHTAITGVTMRELGSLQQLESLSVFDTRIDASSLQLLARLPKLKHLYVGQTKITASSSIPAPLNGKIVF